METYITTSPVKSGGRKHPAGSRLELNPDQAQELIAVGAIGVGDGENPAAASAGVAEAIRGVLAALGADDLKSDGYPRVKSVEALLVGRVEPSLITADLVASVWDARPDKDRGAEEPVPEVTA